LPPTFQEELVTAVFKVKDGGSNLISIGANQLPVYTVPYLKMSQILTALKKSDKLQGKYCAAKGQNEVLGIWYLFG
jgi:hypothetical protein